MKCQHCGALFIRRRGQRFCSSLCYLVSTHQKARWWDGYLFDRALHCPHCDDQFTGRKAPTALRGHLKAKHGLVVCGTEIVTQEMSRSASPRKIERRARKPRRRDVWENGDRGSALVMAEGLLWLGCPVNEAVVCLDEIGASVKLTVRALLPLGIPVGSVAGALDRLGLSRDDVRRVLA